MSETKNETKNPAANVQPGTLKSEILNPACIGSIGGVGNADTIPQDKSVFFLNSRGNGAKAVFESYSDKFNRARRILIAGSEATQGAGHIIQRIRDGLGGFLVGLGKLVQGSSDGVCGGHKIGDIITYRPFGQFQPRQGRIERIVDEYVYVDNGDRVDAFHIFEGGVA